MQDPGPVTQTAGWGWPEGGGRAEWRRAKGGKTGKSVIASTIKVRLINK